MNLSEFLQELVISGWQFWAEEGQVCFQAPDADSTDQVLAQLKQHKRDILTILQEHPEVLQVYPLGYGQQGIWFLWQLFPDNPNYNVSFATRIYSQVNVTTWQQTFEALRKRHPLLCSTFPKCGETPIRQHSEQLDFVQIDASTWDENELQTQVVAAHRHPFDLQTDPVMRVRWFTRSEQEHILLLTIHHIAWDGSSANIIVKELSELYQAHCAGVAVDLPSLQHTYQDYVKWQQQLVEGSKGESLWTYWQQQLAGELPVLNLPTDRPHPPIQTNNGAVYRFQLPEHLVTQVKALSQAEGATLYMTLLAAFQVLLHRYTGQEDILVGSPTSGRTRPEFTSVVGYFVDSMVMRAKVSGSLSFREFLTQVRQTVIDALAHQDYPFSLLVEKLQPERDLSRSPIFQVFFGLHNFLQSETQQLFLGETKTLVHWGGMEVETFLFDQYESLEDLVLEIIEINSQLSGFFKYNTDLFDEQTIAQMASHLQTLLAGIVTHPEQRLESLPLLTQAEQHQLLVEWNQTTTHYPTDKCIHQLFEEQVEQTPDAIAVVFKEEKLSYQELNIRANQLARYLQSLGVSPEVLVGVCVERSLEMIVGLLGILKAGGVYVPLDPKYPQERLDYMFRDSQMSVLLTQQQLLTLLPQYEAKVVCLDRDWQKIVTENPKNVTSEVTAENLAYVIYTSGSTGKPKGVMVAHIGLHNLLKVQIQAFKVSSNSRVLQFASLSFDASIWEIVMALGSGASLYLESRENLLPGASLSKWLNEKKITHLTLPPSALAVMQKEELPSLQTIVVAGEACPAEVISQWSQGRQFVNAYGPTESTVCATMAECSPEYSVLPIGHPIANTQIYLLDNNLQPVPIGIPAEMYIGGIGLARGYLNRPDLTTQKFIPNPFSNKAEQRLYKTGDLARYLPDGNIEFLGRIDHQVKIRGFRIETAEIEAVLNQNPTVKQTVVVAREDKPGDKHLCAYIVAQMETATNSNPELSETHLNSWQEIFNQQIYSQLSEVTDPLFNTTGYLSNYDKQPIPEAQMRDWAEDIVTQVLANKPNSVWEVGCGTGMLLFKIAPHTRAYYGTDISEVSLKYIQTQIAQQPDKYAHVTLAQKAAEEMADIADNSFDVVLLSSIVQYFPSVEYLLQVISNSIRVVKPGGMIFLGDIRSLPLMRAFHTSVQLHKAPPSLSVQQLKQGIYRLMQQETELLVSPELFVALKDTYPEITHVQIRLQRGSEHNELNKYRYSVLLHIQAKPTSVIVAPVENGVGMSMEDIEVYLGQQQPESICFSSLTNGRVATDMAAVELLSQVESKLNVQQLRQQLRQKLVNGIEPEQLHQLSASLGYELELCWSHKTEGCFDAVFVRSSLAPEAMVLTPLTQQSVVGGNWHRYGNNPLASVTGKQLIPQWRKYLEERLPEYMVPSRYVILPQLPLTPNGKVNRKALPAPDNTSSRSTEFVAPETSTEKALAAIWAEVLSIQQVGIHDNFFESGGHSLLATQVVSRIRQALGKELTLQRLLESPTIAELDSALVQLPRVEDSPKQKPDGLLPTIVPAPSQRYQPFPLTEIQQAYWLGRNSHFDLGNITTHGYLELDCENLALDRLSQAWQQVIDHHDMLRMVILPNGEQQVLEQVYPYQIEVLDLRGQPEQIVSTELETIRYRLSHEMFPAGEWPLFKIRVTRLADQRYRLHWSFDALIADAWSMIIVWQQWLQLYQNPDSFLPKLDLTFRDYVLAELSLKDTPQYRRSQQYWWNRLETLPPAPELPLVKQTATLEQPEFNCYRAELSAPDWQQLQARAKQASLTPSGVLLAAFADFLAYWSKSPKFTINLTLFNRLPLHPQVNDLVGDFTSLTLLEVNQKNAAPFAQRAQRLQGQLWQDLDHRYVGGVEVQRELRRQRGSYQPMGVVFTSTLALNTSAEKGLPSNEWHAWPFDQLGETVYMVSKTPQVWLDNSVAEQNGALLLIWNVVEDLFPEGFLNDMFTSYYHWLQQLATSDVAWAQTCPQLLPLSQLTQRLQVNETYAPVSEETLHNLFVKQVQQRPEAIALITPQRTLTYHELYTEAQALGQQVQQLGATPNTLVAVLMEKGWEQIVAVLGILMAGAAYLPIDAALPQERQWSLLEQGEVKLVVTQAALNASLGLPDHLHCLVVASQPQEIIDTPLEANVSSSDLAYVIFTSGSTGTPKGVMIDHRGAVNTIQDINQRFDVQPTDRMLAVSALNFDLSVYDIFGLLAAGGTLVMPTPEAAKDPVHWVELMTTHQVTLWNTVPALMQMLVEYLSEHPDQVTEDLRLALLSGDWIPLNLPTQIQSLWPQGQVVSLGGATEASIWSVYYPITTVEPEWKSIPYGKPLVNQSLHVLNHNLDPCPNWVPGQLYIGGIGLAQGYWRDEQKTNASFILHPQTGERLYKTGDLARYLPDGNSEFLGREDFQVKISGYRIELGEIEATLLGHATVKETVVAAVGELQSKQLVAYVVFHSESSSDSATEDVHDDMRIDELRHYLQQQLPEYMVPPSYMVLDALPLTANGKVDRKRLPTPELISDHYSPDTYIPPRNHQELQLVKLWEEILEVQPIGVGSHFFDLGGHSLLAVRLMNRIE
ncbi:non-ribosomal peptide synthetase, partial [Moorena sp. SIO3B2]